MCSSMGILRALSIGVAAWLTVAGPGSPSAWALAPGQGDAPVNIATPPAFVAEDPLLQPITANFQEVDFTAAMDFLAESGGMNIILSEQARAVGKPVTVHLVEMALQRVLEHLLNGQGLLFRYDGDTIWVATRDELEAEPVETKVYFLKNGPGLYATFDEITETRASVALAATGVREMLTVKDILDEVIPTVPGSSIILDERSGALVVTHAPYYLQQIEALLQQIDIDPGQVLIEARFVEVTIDEPFELGFEALLTGNLALTKKHAGDGSRGSNLQFSATGTTLARGTLTNFTAFPNQTSGLNLTFQSVLSGTEYQAVLHALMTMTKTKTLSAPRIMTLNHQTAAIKIVTEFVYATRYEASVTREDLNGDGDFTDVVNGVRETRFVNVPQDFVTKDLGILLYVTPSIGGDRRTITLALRPEVTEKKTDDSFGGEVSLPRFTTRDLETTIVLQSGETAVLGGLMKDTTTITNTRVPVLGSLPLVGRLFRKENHSITERSNLLIFVSAYVVEPSGTRLIAREVVDPRL